MTEETYTVAADGQSITCHRCGLTSHNQTDVRQLYCAKCHQWHSPRGDLVGTAMYVYKPGAAEPEISLVRLPQRPTLKDLHRVLDPLFVRDGQQQNFEHVAVLHKGERADMFVDECGVLEGLPRNDAATDIYLASWLERHPEVRKEDEPHIAGPAVVFGRIVWR